MKKVTVLLRIKRVLEAGIAWGLFFFIKLLPIDIASNVLGKLLRTVGPMIAVSRTARINLDIIFPNKSKEEKENILLSSWENLGRVLGEFPHLREIAQQNERITIIGHEFVDEIHRSGKSAIVFSGHFANWEMFASISKHSGKSISLVYRAADNPLTDALYRYARKDIARALYPKNREGAKQIFKALKGDEIVGMLVDQKMNDGVEMPFFGKPAMTAKAIAEFSLRQEVPIYPARIIRGNGARFTVEILPALVLPKTDDFTQDTVTLLTTINQLLEQWITEKPEDWFWLHRRWPKEMYR